MRILLLGATGQVGSELVRTLPSIGSVITTSRSIGADHAIDLQDLNRLRDILDAVAPDIIVNASAYTTVDKAESEPDAAMRLNAKVPAVIGAWAAKRGALVVHYSTDYVYGGTKPGPYIETDTPDPLNVYGRTKLAGDEALLASGCTALILRVSWVYGLRGNNFLLTMRRLMRERKELRIVDDQTGAPTWSRSIARATTAILAQMPPGTDERLRLAGVYHLSPSGRTTWFGFASAIREHLDISSCKLIPISTEQYPTPAKRPKNSRLDSGKLKETFGVALQSWDQELAQCLNALNLGDISRQP